MGHRIEQHRQKLCEVCYPGSGLQINVKEFKAHERSTLAHPAIATVSAITLRTIKSAAELTEVYRFRYNIYVTELGRSPKNVDHDKRELRHSLDLSGTNIAAYKDSSIVGVVRNNFWTDGSFGPLDEFYGIDQTVCAHPYRTSITSGLMVGQRNRSGLLAKRLAVAAYVHALANGVRWNFIDCITKFTDFFRALGYVEHLPEAAHPEYLFNVNRLRLDLEDESHLTKVRSPFLVHLRKYREAERDSIKPGSLRRTCENQETYL